PVMSNRQTGSSFLNLGEGPNPSCTAPLCRYRAIPARCLSNLKIYGPLRVSKGESLTLLVSKSLTHTILPLDGHCGYTGWLRAFWGDSRQGISRTAYTNASGGSRRGNGDVPETAMARKKRAGAAAAEAEQRTPPTEAGPAKKPAAA